MRCWWAHASAAGSLPRWRCATPRRFAGLVLAAPLGIKLGGVLDRDIADMHAIPRAEFMRLAWADPARGEIDYAVVAGHRTRRHRARTRGVGAVRLEAVHAQSAAETLAASDRHPDPADLGRAGRHRLARRTGEAWQARNPRRHAWIRSPDAGHYPHWEQPERFADGSPRFTDTGSEETGTMRTWYFSEMAYHPAWEKGLARGSLRVNFPNREPRSGRGAASC